METSRESSCAGYLSAMFRPGTHLISLFGLKHFCFENRVDYFLYFARSAALSAAGTCTMTAISVRRIRTLQMAEHG